ncbi:MAG: CRISPR-associated endoribonuclease Cas6 [Clostridia bacterium]
MRFKLEFKLENEYLDIDYRRSILSFIKKSFEMYDKQYYEKCYHEKDCLIKPYTFAIFFLNSIFQKDKILVKEKRFNVIFSTSDFEYAIILYNSFNNQLNKKTSLNKNSMTLYSIVMLPEKEVEQEAINIKFLSPLVVKKRVNNKDTYMSFQREEFLDTLKINIKEQLKISNIDTKKVDSFNIEPILAKKVIIKNYGINLECSVGKFRIYGDKELLEYLYKNGVSSKRSMGFGCFQIIE